MLVEIALMQRLVVFLGQPVYSLSVVLFSLLISGGLGSWSTQRINDQKLQKAALLRLGMLLIIILVLNKGLLLVLNEFQSSPNSVRILISICMICPIGFLMGMAFPLGMKAAAGRVHDITAWLWGINGATSVCASVGAIVISLAAGISVTYLCGFICYVLAFASFYWAMSVRGDS
jgi:predicted membrane-bound spermidine synthase